MNATTFDSTRLLARLLALAVPALCWAQNPPATGSSASFTRLVPLSAPAIVAVSSEFPGGSFKAAHLLDGETRTEFSSKGDGTNTFLELDFGKPVLIAGFRHVDRNDPARVGSSELSFRDGTGAVLATVPVTHVNQPTGVTFAAVPKPVRAQRVRWRITALGSHGYGTVGGAEIQFYTADQPEAAPSGAIIEARVFPVLMKRVGGLIQPLTVAVDYPYLEPTEAVLRIEGFEPKALKLSFGLTRAEFAFTAAESSRVLPVDLEFAGKAVVRTDVTVKPARQWDVYVLPHSHVDIGYTALQTDVEQKQMRNLARGIELAKATADAPEGARYKWNVEVLWAVESYLKQQPPEQQQEFIEAVRKGWIGLDALYGNELTALCRPEELLRLFRYATQLGERCGVPVETAMISDVPGYTWGIISAMAQAGVKYWSIGPNYIDRMGATFVEWENKPFWWIGPSGRDRVLCWVPFQGYAISHKTPPEKKTEFLFELVQLLERTHYPYDVVHLRWSGYGDNAVPDELMPPFVREWNEKYASPRLILATTAEAFRAFDRRYGDTLPCYRGDWTPYWEDGAASSARETALNRAAAERLTQAEALFAMLKPAAYPAAAFAAAWRRTILYDEHTWGAHNSISEPDAPFVKDQWKIKQAFALEADQQSRELLAQALAQRRGATGPVAPGAASGPVAALDVFNTTSWPRTELVTVPKELELAGTRVKDSQGRAVPSQRLQSGELVFLARAVPPFAAERFLIEAGPATAPARAKAEGISLTTSDLAVRIDENTGAIASLHSRTLNREFVDAKAPIRVNEYLYLPGDKLADLKRASDIRVSVLESGPLVASLLIESAAPGCRKLSTALRVVDGLDYVEILNVVDKKAIRTKEGVHFGFAFDVPNGEMRLDLPFAVMRPEQDQIPGSCKNWFTVSRWIDVANEDYGVTCATLDAPLIEVGDITGTLLGSQTNPKTWRSHVAPTQTFYSWVMNNHWHTNYRADQDGPTLFRYCLRPHGRFSPDDAARFGIARSQPLIAVPAAGDPPSRPRLTIEPPGVMVTALKPSDDGRAWIVRLFGASGKTHQATLTWADPKPAFISISDLTEKARAQASRSIEVPAYGLVTLRAEKGSDHTSH